ncbi:hypothetical protein [Deinococcus radiotolerans]|uniref:Uncharacterized protein n=1 Tax=Deinococcus radiotolerans TaxID=1309407 RepID=A0ABQ2FHM4_9DEIO|nr:hypothetical protein [Deinococcus radiotolerans]GGK91395.1 hypothetical protein GCM10010844_07380 [Deinococcus radiotolerans]
MDKYKVKRYFADAETGKTYKKGDTFSGSPERVRELQSSGLLNRTAEAESAPKATTGKK